jgi:hypothetical protein
MIDYAEGLLESHRLIKQIHAAALKRNFELANQLTESLNFVTQELSDTFRKLHINDKH